ncbi:MAG TPA: glycosyltransferase family 39 protein [Thermoanaerobaculia bacterium]|nr:glycosyltransferase family 39 protein [Thermoanaerobaculia bacterium]
MRTTRALLLLASAALFFVAVHRAATFPFVYDESMSYSILTWNPEWRGDANHHPLNTLLMQAAARALGTSELALRTGSLLACVLYLACTLLVLKRLEHPALQLAGFGLLALNPFVLDFFSLARGYGLALAFEMLSLYFLIRAFEEGGPKYVVLAVAAGAMAVYSNYAFLNFFLPLLAVTVWLMRRHARQAVALYAASGAFLIAIGWTIAGLHAEGRFYFGGRTGFLRDSVVSLVRASLYRASYAEAAEWIVVAIVVILFNILLLLAFRREVTLLTLLIVTLTAAILLPALEHVLLGFRFPLDRAALAYIPPFALALSFGLQSAVRRARWLLALPILIAVALTAHYTATFDPSTNYLWAYDAHDDEAMDLIAQDRERAFPGRTVRVGASWMLEPSLNFYRVTRNYAWMPLVPRQPFHNGGFDYVYAFEQDLADVPPGPRVTLASFPDTKTVLLRFKE